MALPMRLTSAWRISPSEQYAKTALHDDVFADLALDDLTPKESQRGRSQGGDVGESRLWRRTVKEEGAIDDVADSFQFLRCHAAVGLSVFQRGAVFNQVKQVAHGLERIADFMSHGGRQPSCDRELFGVAQGFLALRLARRGVAYFKLLQAGRAGDLDSA